MTLNVNHLVAKQTPAVLYRADEFEEEEETGDGVQGSNPYDGMSARQRKLHELRNQLKMSRKANQNAVIAEKKRIKVSGHAV